MYVLISAVVRVYVLLMSAVVRVYVLISTVVRVYECANERMCMCVLMSAWTRVCFCLCI